jgi:hypothetical protein
MLVIRRLLRGKNRNQNHSCPAFSFFNHQNSESSKADPDSAGYSVGIVVVTPKLPILIDIG